MTSVNFKKFSLGALLLSKRFPLPSIIISADSFLFTLFITPFSEILKSLKIRLLLTICSVAPESATNSINSLE